MGVGFDSLATNLCTVLILLFFSSFFFQIHLFQVTSVLCSIGLGVVITGICPLLFEHYSGQIGYTLLFGFYSGFWTTFLSQVSRELIGAECIALGNGYLSFMIALGSLAAGPAAGTDGSLWEDIFQAWGSLIN